MKKLLSLALVLSATCGIYAQRQDVTVVEGVDKVVISTNKFKNRVQTKAVKDNWNMEYPFIGSAGRDQDACWSFTAIKDMYWGWNFNYDGKGYLKNCFEVGVANVFGVSVSPFTCGPSFNVGLGFGMRRYLVQSGYRFDRVSNNLVIEPDYGLDIDKSRMDSWTFHLPIMVTQKVYKDLAVSAGAWINFNTYVRGETQYYDGDVRFKEEYKGFNQRFCTVDVVLAAGLKNGIAFYSRFSPMSLFTDGRGPKCKSASIGVMLNF